MRKLHFVPLIALAAVAFAAGPASAPAAGATTCQGQFDTLAADTQSQSVVITGGKVDKERAGLVKLVEDARALAARGKTSDATTKLRDYEVKVDQLEVAGRIDTTSAGLLREDAEAAIACIGFEA